MRPLVAEGESRQVDTTAVGDERITESRHACSSGAVATSSSPESVSASPEAGRGRVGLDCVVDTTTVHTGDDSRLECLGMLEAYRS